VLVVEDEALIRSLMVETLLDAGFDVEEAANSDTAAEMLEADGYRLLVTDVHMPGALDGIDLAELAHAHDPDMAVVVVTGRPDVMGRLKRSGIRGATLPKPFQLAELVNVIGRYIKLA
jgi:two-component system cell cycle sensor histidine kinase/response regulator CckA